MSTLTQGGAARLNFLTAGSLLALISTTPALTTPAWAQNSGEQTVAMLPAIEVTASRLGDGITGTSVSVIERDEIEHSPAATLQELLGRLPGIQLQRQFGGVAGARDAVDIRGFGATASSNTLVLVNGRRLNDLDLAGIDFSAINRSGIERIEVIRGNSGAVLYGDGAVGGVINIVTRQADPGQDGFSLDAGAGSFQQREGGFSANQSVGPFSFMAFGNWIDSDGYRRNNKLLQKNLLGEARYRGDGYGLYATLSLDDQQLGLPGTRRRTLTSDLTQIDPEGTTTPFDYGNKQGQNLTFGGNAWIADGANLVIDAGIRAKQQDSFFDNSGFPSYVDTELTTWSLTPRLLLDGQAMEHKLNTILGFDYYLSDYQSDRQKNLNFTPIHQYNARQATYAGYGQSTIALTDKTDISGGLRLQRSVVSATDDMNANAPGYGSEAAARPLNDAAETNYAFHIGIEHRLMPELVPFARVGRSFRYPTLDERIGMAPFGTPGSFVLKTQTSRDYEAGLRGSAGPVDYRLSAFWMDLKDEIHFNPVSFINFNLDPTRRRGLEAEANWRLLSDVKLRGGLAYTEAEFRDGPNKGHDVPLVSPWTASAGVTWDIVEKWLRLDLDGRFVDSRRMDNDQKNFQPKIPAVGIVDLAFSGRILDHGRWSFAVNNLLGREYFDYSVASATTFGTYNAYPLPGRTYMARVGLDF